MGREAHCGCRPCVRCACPGSPPHAYSYPVKTRRKHPQTCHVYAALCTCARWIKPHASRAFDQHLRNVLTSMDQTACMLCIRPRVCTIIMPWMFTATPISCK
jgi:hypothetical protein